MQRVINIPPLVYRSFNFSASPSSRVFRICQTTSNSDPLGGRAERDAAITARRTLAINPHEYNLAQFDVEAVGSILRRAYVSPRVGEGAPLSSPPSLHMLY